MEKFAIVICSRSDSSRLPNKPFLRINGRPLIEFLIDRCVETGLPVYIAVPFKEYNLYKNTLKSRPGVIVVAGHPTDCLRRTLDVADEYGIDHVIRVTHDKVFIDHRQVEEFTRFYIDNKLEYLYSTNFIDGMSFEIFSTLTLRRASCSYKNVEHISFAIDAVAVKKRNIRHFKRNLDWLSRKKPKCKLRLLIDYEFDFDVMEELLSQLPFLATIDDVVELVDDNQTPNCLPLVSIYTCSYNDYEFLGEAVESVLGQKFEDFEYLLIDDGSTDPKVSGTMRKYEAVDDRIRTYRQDPNLGLASSSNNAVQLSLGKYIMRLDADDYFFTETVLGDLYDSIRNQNCDIVYPDNIAGHEVQRGYEHHHVGGSIFRKRALDYLRFTDGLRHYDGKDLYARAKEKKLRIGYCNEVAFCYRQRAGSLSRSNLDQRKQISEKIDSGIVGKKLL